MRTSWMAEESLAKTRLETLSPTRYQRDAACALCPSLSQSLAERSPWGAWFWHKCGIGFKNKALSQLLPCSQRSDRCILKAISEANLRCMKERVSDVGIAAQSCSGRLVAVKNRPQSCPT